MFSKAGILLGGGCPLLALTVCLAFCAISLADDETPSNSMEGKPLVRIKVVYAEENNGGDLPGDITGEELRNQVESILKKSNIPETMEYTLEMSREGIPAPKTRPMECYAPRGNCGLLILSLQFIRQTPTLYFYSLRLGFWQMAQPARQPAVFTNLMEAWNDSVIGSSASQNVKLRINGAITRLVQGFAIEYLKANSRDWLKDQ